jgi:glycerol-3-phosphate acyltransferase PlsY
MAFLWALSISLSYFLGNLPSAHLVSNRKGFDLTQSGSGNPGATNVLRVAGRRAGVLVLIADFSKGSIGAAVGLLIDGTSLGLACWLASVVGHVFPIIRKFQGGKGVATGAGGCLVLFPLVGVICTAGFLLIAKISKKVSVASISIAMLMPLPVVLFGAELNELLAVVSLSILILIRHRTNFQRLLSGSEHSLGIGE